VYEVKQILYIVLILSIITSLSFSTTTLSYFVPLNGTSSVAPNVSMSYKCIGTHATYTGNIYVNGTLANTLVATNDTIYNYSIVLSSGIYNLTAECINGGENDNETHRLGFFKTQNYSYTPNITAMSYNGMIAYTNSFLESYFSYAEALFIFGCSFLVTRNLQQTMFAGSAGLLGIFFLTSTPIFFAGSVLALAVGFVLKYVGG
jgi:hypothetical protein